MALPLVLFSPGFGTFNRFNVHSLPPHVRFNTISHGVRADFVVTPFAAPAKVHIVEHGASAAKHSVVASNKRSTYVSVDPTSPLCDQGHPEVCTHAERFKGECFVASLTPDEAQAYSSGTSQQDATHWLVAGFEVLTTASGDIITFDGRKVTSMAALMEGAKVHGRHDVYEHCEPGNDVAYRAALARAVDKLQTDAMTVAETGESSLLGSSGSFQAAVTDPFLGLECGRFHCEYSWCGSNSGGGCDYTATNPPTTFCARGTGKTGMAGLTARVADKCAASHATGRSSATTMVERKTGDKGKNNESVPVCYGSNCPYIAEADGYCASHDNAIWPWHNPDLTTTQSDACWDALNVQPNNPKAASNYKTVDSLLNCTVSGPGGFGFPLSCQANRDLVIGMRNLPSFSFCFGGTGAAFAETTILIFAHGKECMVWVTTERKLLSQGGKNTYTFNTLEKPRWEIDRSSIDTTKTCHPKGCYKSDLLENHF